MGVHREVISDTERSIHLMKATKYLVTLNSTIVLSIQLDVLSSNPHSDDYLQVQVQSEANKLYRARREFRESQNPL